MRLNGIFIVLVFISFLKVDLATSQTKEYNDSTALMVMNSDTRKLLKLNGYWETSIDNEEFISVFFPQILYNCNQIKLRKIIRLDKQLIQNSVWHLFFLGVNDEIELYWNNQFLGKYISDGSPLWITLPRKILVKENNEVEFVVTKSNPLAYQTKKNYLYYQKLAVGISRDFFLVRTPLVWINNFIIGQDFDAQGKAILKTKANISSFEVENLLKLNNTLSQVSKNPFTLETILRNKESKQIIGQSQATNFDILSFRNYIFEQSIGISNPTYWEPETPYLYELEIKLSLNGILIDKIYQDVGFTKWDTRKVKDSFGWLLNGKPFNFKAIDIVEDYNYYNSENTIKKIESDIRNLKSLGANAVRFIFSAPNPIFVSLANKYGILILLDLPVYYVPTSILKKSYFFVRYQTIMENFLKIIKPSPSFFAIGFGEGLDFSQAEVLDYIKKLNNKINLYPNVKKYVSFVLGQNVQEIENIDFYLVKDNFKIKQNEQVFALLKSVVSSVDKPIVFNFGTIIDPNNHNGYNDLLSVEYQAFYLYNRYIIRTSVGNAGVLFSTFNDYYTENPIGKSAKNNPYVCYSGILNYNNQRIAYNMLKSLFNNEETPVINPGQTTSDFPLVFIIAGSFAFLLWGILINRSRRFREHTFRSLFRTYNFFADIRDRRLISNIQTGIFGFVLSIIVGLYSSSLLHYYKTNESFNVLSNLLLPNDFVKETILKLSWQPENLVITFSLIIFLKLILLALILKFSSIFIRSKIFISDTFKMVIWSGAPLLFLLPIAIFVNRILPISSLLGYAFSILFSILILYWVCRLTKSIWIVFDLRPSKVYLVTSIIIIILVFSYFYYLEFKFSFFQYVSHYSKWFL